MYLRTILNLQQNRLQNQLRFQVVVNLLFVWRITRISARILRFQLVCTEYSTWYMYLFTVNVHIILWMFQWSNFYKSLFLLLIYPAEVSWVSNSFSMFGSFSKHCLFLMARSDKKFYCKAIASVSKTVIN